MEGNLPRGSLMPGTSRGFLDLQGSVKMHHPQHMHATIHAHHRQSMVHPLTRDAFPPPSSHECGQQQLTLPVADYGKGDRGKGSVSDEDDPSFNTEDGSHEEAGKGKKGSTWHRVKWTDGMVKLLITAVSYIGEEASSECSAGGRRKSAVLQKKGKWKLISKAMAERDHFVSPQQCEDKFNDLNKRYKRITDILGRGTSCKVVENPALLDLMDLSDKAKDDVRKILNSKQLFYEEMCSYHNCNRLHLPADPALHRSLQLALRSRDQQGMTRTQQDDFDEDDHGADSDDMVDDVEENNALNRDIGRRRFLKRLKVGEDQEKKCYGNSSCSQDNNKWPHSQGISVDMNQVFPEGPSAEWEQKQWLKSRSLQLEEQRLHIQAEMMELEKQRYKWQLFSQKKDRELEKMRLENEKMKFENEKMRLELKRKELERDL